MTKPALIPTSTEHHEHPDEWAGPRSGLVLKYDLHMYMVQKDGYRWPQRDYIIAGNKLHIMRYRGLNEDGNQYFRIACGSRCGADYSHASYGGPHEDWKYYEACWRCFPRHLAFTKHP